jgi:radical SAM protein with 4Fe4S-binding SPASM domain
LKDQELTSLIQQFTSLKQQKDQELVFKDQELTALRKDIEYLKQQKDQEITTKNQELLFKDRELAALIKEFTSLKQQKDQEITAKDKELLLKDQELTSLIQQFTSLKQQKDQELVFKDQELTALRKDIESLKQQKDQEITAKDKELLLKDQELTSLIQQFTSLKQQKDQEITAKNQELLFKDRELAALSQQIVSKDQELQNIYNSTGYRYLLEPLWNFLWPIKLFLRKGINFMNQDIEFTLISRIKENLKKNKTFMKFYYSDTLFSMMLQWIYRMRNPWLNVYYCHLKKCTYPPYPDTLVLMLTKRCNLSCQFCNIQNTNEEMKTEDAIRVIDNVNKLGLSWLIITGGEPLLHQGVFDIVSYAKNLGIKTCITTNGILIGEKIDEIYNSGLNVISISLDGLDETHDYLRGRPGLFEKVKSNILRLKEDRRIQSVAINFVLTNKNIKDLESLYYWAKEKNIYFDFWPVNHYRQLYINPKEDYIKLLGFVKKLKRDRAISRSRYYYYLKALLYINNHQRLKVRCLGLAKNLGVDVNGDITPCCVWTRDRRNLGNAIQDDFETLWHSKEYWQIRNNIYHKGCSEDCYNISLQEFMHITGKTFILSQEV